NSAVLPRSSSSDRLWKSGSSVAIYAACSASRLRRRPSPKRSAFSREPMAGISVTGYRRPPPSQGRGLNLPQVAGQMRGPDDVLLPGRAAGRLERRNGAESRLPVDVQRPRLTGRDELRLSPGEPRGRDDLDSARRHCPEAAATAHGLDAVRSRERRLDRLAKRRERSVGRTLASFPALDHRRAVGKHHGVQLLAAQVVRPRGRDDVEAPGTRNAVDARLAAGLSVE